VKPRAITSDQLREARLIRSRLGWSFQKTADAVGCKEGTLRYHLNQADQMDALEIAKRLHRSAAASVAAGRVSKMTKNYTVAALKRRLEKSGTCALTGHLFEYKTGSPWFPSSDRLDNAGPYSMRNTHLVCVLVNTTRHALSIPEFISLCRDVAYFADNPTISRAMAEAFANAQ
jgi:hypothetical protein